MLQVADGGFAFDRHENGFTPGRRWQANPELETTYCRMSHQAQQLFCTQAQTLKRYQAKEQKIVVQHVSVSEQWKPVRSLVT